MSAFYDVGIKTINKDRVSLLLSFDLPTSIFFVARYWDGTESETFGRNIIYDVPPFGDDGVQLG